VTWHALSNRPYLLPCHHLLLLLHLLHLDLRRSLARLVLAAPSAAAAVVATVVTVVQGPTLVHFSAQCTHLLRAANLHFSFCREHFWSIRIGI